MDQSFNWLELDLVWSPPVLTPVDVGSQLHVGLEMVKVVTNQVINESVLSCQLPLKDTDFILKVLNLSKLRKLDDHQVVQLPHPPLSLSRKSINVYDINTDVE